MPTESEVDALAAARSPFTGVVSIDVDGEPELVKAYGFAHRAHQVPNTPDTRIAIASGSKVFTALAVLSLVEEGVLALDTPVRSILNSDLPLIDDRVTIEHLLTHHSGIGDYIDEDGDFEVDDYVLSVPVHTLDQTEAFLPVLDGFEQAFTPGEGFAYCNGGYMVLALVAERASGTPFHDLVQTRVFDKAGMSRSGYLRSDDLPADAALGYLDDEGNRTNVLHLPVRGNGDGGAYATAGDLTIFWRALLDGRIVSHQTVAEMTRPRAEVPDEDKRSGMGLFLLLDRDALVIEGYDAGASFRSTHDPETQRTVSILGNSSEGAWSLIYGLGV
ncbi:serine hydrolase domain-containing protein [Microcella sp.]|uniref:serine hydrolase domain-containing protein n=1 Tax=Microcella sp. TaxID=1913979 RepID=UPI0025604C4C|nr:serine hydrolase domain-containing protein [Microcella sp.]MBX9470392.1 beta-lactamase family protein [Microcella sp.]